MYIYLRSPKDEGVEYTCYISAEEKSSFLVMTQPSQREAPAPEI